ncbi:MAG: type II toxin-antitoxin system VapC family toxin [Terrimicrobiaceae bacterium]
MKTAIDSSVILSIYKAEPSGILWLEKLIALRRSSRLVACDVVIAETRPALPSDEVHRLQLEKLGVQFLPISFETACRAGQIQQAYRAAGGRRDRMIADFLVGAHALLQAGQLATDDDGFMRKYFEPLKLVGLQSEDP